MKNTYKIYLTGQNGKTYYYGMIQAPQQSDANEIGRAIAETELANFAQAQPTIESSINKFFEDMLVNRLEEIRDSLKSNIDSAEKKIDRINKTLARL